MKVKSLADYVDKKIEEIKENEHQTFAQAELVCPFCGWKHDAEDLNIRKQSEGLVKCSGCGEAFEFEAVRKVAYTTFVP